MRLDESLALFVEMEIACSRLRVIVVSGRVGTVAVRVDRIRRATEQWRWIS